MIFSRVARIKYKFSADFFRPDGRVIFGDISAARAFAAQMSALRDSPVPAAELYALSILDQAYRILLRHYHDRQPGVISHATGELKSGLGENYELTLTRFIEEFPPVSVINGEMTADEYLAGEKFLLADASKDIRAATLEEILLVNVYNNNPAVKPFAELFDESVFSDSPYKDFIKRLTGLFSSMTGIGNSGGTEGESLIDALYAPIKASPDSLEGQLRFIIEKWGHLLGESFSARILRGLDFIREEVIRKRRFGGSQRVETFAPTYNSGEYAEYERYSADKEWMPRLVLLARNTYVWLHQLSKKYQREIRTLDQIPNEELELLSSSGFTGLWLIGLWERSKASQRIKQRMGQDDAVASAYSLHSYDIASDLGGWDALNNLRSRAWEHGIRLSADMVPNHMGIDSNWVVEHPDWFLSSQHSPFPSYSFKSENLSDDLRVGIYLEDHYYDKSDASVVFQRRDLQTGDLRYIYHGNDGTSFPWNDTAQLDYTRPEVREAVIQVILHVARNFPVIRFDAAMTLAKKHVQRLWFPEPGAGGAIPSRSQYGLTRAEFDEKVPEEFWREVVDRVAAEVPDTLLLAEAFWLMEGYFVRTLGMHRVYNSAFMHMLRDEDNAKYRIAIKNTLEFDPQILKRYVNFMNNPDEKTAVEQFGDGDKYFGVCTLLSTLPGLPMFGHGQVEGYYEKYGMEFRRAKWDENPNEGLVRGHEWRIFPLLHRRYLFADVEHFLLFDFYADKGKVIEDVFAYSNRFNDERGLVIYHNKFAAARGWIKISAAVIDKGSGKLFQKDLADGLALPDNGYVIFKDYVTKLEYIRSCKELWADGLYVELSAYQCYVFMDFQFVNGELWREICLALNGAGIQSMQARWNEIAGSQVVRDVQEKKPAKRNIRKAAVKKAESKTKTTRKPAENRKESSVKVKVQPKKRTLVKKESKKVKKIPLKKGTSSKKTAIKKPILKSEKKVPKTK